MNEWQIVKELGKQLIGLTKKARDFNSEQREEIRKIISELIDDLDGAMRIAQSNLEELKLLNNKDDLVKKLRTGQDRLIDQFREHDVCWDLRTIRDRYSQWFTGVKAVINVENQAAFENLTYNLERGERLVYDELNDIFKVCRKLADDIQLNDKSVAKIRPILFEELEKVHNEIESHRKSLRGMLDDLKSFM